MGSITPPTHIPSHYNSPHFESERPDESPIHVTVPSSPNPISLDSCFGNVKIADLMMSVAHSSSATFAVGSSTNYNDCCSRPSLALCLSRESEKLVGKRETIFDLPIYNVHQGNMATLYKLRPVNVVEENDDDWRAFTKSPETVLSRSDCASTTASSTNFPPSRYNTRKKNAAWYDYEPVVEWCMQNQRLRSNTPDVYSLDKGRDLLSSHLWSPGNDVFYELDVGAESRFSFDATIITTTDSSTPPIVSTPISTRHTPTTSWLRPYHTSDIPEWTDMTSLLQTSRERYMLPDNHWIWLNDWTVDIPSNELGIETDDDGWEYESDFECFDRHRTYYKRGDGVRRRRWTRTRMVKAAELGDPRRMLGLVWETRRVGLEDEASKGEASDGGSGGSNGVDLYGGCFLVTVMSRLRVRNEAGTRVGVFAYCHSWDGDRFIGEVEPEGTVHVPIILANCTYLRLGMNKKKSRRDTRTTTTTKVGKEETTTTTTTDDYWLSKRLMIVPTSYISTVILRATINQPNATTDENDYDNNNNVHFLIHINCIKGISTIYIKPVLKICNLLPCQLSVKLGETTTTNQSSPSSSTLPIYPKEQLTISTGNSIPGITIDPSLKPHLSLRLPGYEWSSWQRIVNRKSKTETWLPSEEEERLIFQTNSNDAEYADEYKTVVKMTRQRRMLSGASGGDGSWTVDGEGDDGNGNGDPLTVIVSVEAGHCPTVRVYAQYWILDKTGFGLRFSEGFSGLLPLAGMSLVIGDTSRRSYLPKNHVFLAGDDEYDEAEDWDLPGHQWSIGMNGMTLYFSRKEKLSLKIESDAGGYNDVTSRDNTNETNKTTSSTIKSIWSSSMDVSNVMPNTVFSLEEESNAAYSNSNKKFELALNVSLCPAIFSRTKLITIIPRYRIVNLLDMGIHVAQDGMQMKDGDMTTFVPSQASVPFHWDNSSLPPKVRIACASSSGGGCERTWETTNASSLSFDGYGGGQGGRERRRVKYSYMWTNGCIQLDKIGITSMRLPNPYSQKKNAPPMVLQAEVRLATKDQNTAVVIVLWTTKEERDPLYLLRNKSSKTIMCCQPLFDQEGVPKDNTYYDEDVVSYDGCSTAIDLNEYDGCSPNIDLNESCSNAEAILSSPTKKGRSSPRRPKKNHHHRSRSAAAAVSTSSYLPYHHHHDNSSSDEFLWYLPPGKETCFGFEDPEKPHLLKWSCIDETRIVFEEERNDYAILEVDAMGSSSFVTLGDGRQIKCQIRAEHSTKIIEFRDVLTLEEDFDDDDDDDGQGRRQRRRHTSGDGVGCSSLKLRRVGNMTATNKKKRQPHVHHREGGFVVRSPHGSVERGGTSQFQSCLEHDEMNSTRSVDDIIDDDHDDNGDCRDNSSRVLGTTSNRCRLDYDDDDDEYDDVEDDDEQFTLTFRMDLPGITVSVVDNAKENTSGREILFLQLDSWMVEFSQSRGGYHEIEVRLMSLQLDNHVHLSVHPVLIFCPRIDEREPFLHMSAVRRLQPHNNTYVFRYAALRILEIDIFLDRRTAEVIAKFVQPLRKVQEVRNDDPRKWISNLTQKMANTYAKPNRRAPRYIEKIVYAVNSGRIYFEQLHLHPIRLSLTFTQEWTADNPATEGLMIFQFIRGMASIANAPLTFTSFVVSHAFESPQALMRIIGAHYSSQLTKQIFGIIGSLAILGAPADFLANVGTGVRDFFYEPINGMVQGPAQFIEGLEAGTQSLARGLLIGVVRGAANVTEVVNSNLADLTADYDFIDERNAHQRLLTEAWSRGTANRTIGDSLCLAGESVARGVKSGAMGIFEQPTRYASMHGPAGFLQGVGKAIVGAIVKPIVGVGDAAVLVMNHVSEATNDKTVLLKIPKRLRRALPRISSDRPLGVHLVPYNEKAAKAQKIVTGGESVDDVYLGHVNTANHLIIASEQCLWAINRRTREPWCLSWEEMSHFAMLEDGAMRVTVFSETGLKSYVFKVETAVEFAELYQLLSMQVGKMGNCSSNFADLDNLIFKGGLNNVSNQQLPGFKSKQIPHVFGSCNVRRKVKLSMIDDIDVIEQCFGRVKLIGSEMPSFLTSLDEEAWNLVHSWGQVHSGLSSKRCVAAGIINGTGSDIQIKSTKLVEGGSPCYTIPSKEYNQEQAILHPGGCIIFFGWGRHPSLVQAGRVFMNIETNAFVGYLTDRKSRANQTLPLPGFQVGFMEKSYDPSGWWAKYWLLVRKI